MVDLEATLRASLDGRYAIEGEVGRGGMSVVFRAHDEKHNRTVAIKVLRPELSEQIGADRFHREIEVVARLTHPHILALHDSGEVDGLYYFVMPLIEGESLRARLDREGRLPMPDAIRITREIAGALGFAHRHGVVHRDVKPGNILLTEDHALLADFGVAHLAESDGGTLTGSGLALGTPSYFSPEQATGEHDVDGRSDVYSLGCVLYEAIAGAPPFMADNVRGLITKHLVEEPPRLREQRPEVSDGVEAVVQTALQKDPEKRFQTADEMAGSLDLVSGGFEAMAAAALRKLLGPRYRWLHGRRLAALALMAALVLIAGGLLVRSVLVRPAFAGAYPTYAILPYEGEELTEEEKGLSRQGARKLYLHLLGWESITVVDGQTMEGPALQLVQAGLGLPTASVGAGLRFADRVNASHLIYVDADVSGDSVTLVARVHFRDEVTPHEQLPAKGPKNDINDIALRLALGILGLHGESRDTVDLKSRSGDPIARQQYLEGREALLDWRLAEAEAHFRAAVSQDSAFAMAHYQLAMTMYWRTVRDPSRTLDGKAIQHHVQRAHEYGDEVRLRPGDRRDLDAFRSFFAGNYETARSRYESILSREPFNLDALVLAGAVEFEDPWLAVDSEGELLRPRGDLNRARAVFDSAVSLSSDVQLAWGRLFDIDREVARSALVGRCNGFLPPGGPEIPPYEFPEAALVNFYCPYVEDGLIYWRPDSLSAEERERAAAEVQALRGKTVRRLEFWESVQINQARPHEELADWILWERSVSGCAANPEWADSLVRAARAHTEEALAIRGDTTPEDRIRLGGLMLAAGEVSQAADEIDRALQDLGEWHDGNAPPPPKSAANVYLAIGDGHPAAEILEAVDNRYTWAAEDNIEAMGSIPGGQVLGTLFALRVLGMTGDDDPGIADRFSTVEQTWSRFGYSERQQSLLRSATTGIVSPALLRQPEQQQRWFEDWHEFGIETPPVWKGLMAAEIRPNEAHAHLTDAIQELEALPPEARRAIDYYMPIRLAERLADETTAADLAARAATCPLRVETIDFGWGMRRYLAGE